MFHKSRWFLGICGLILIANFVVMMAYGDTLRSTHLFITRSTVFYPLAWLNLIAGIILIGLLIRKIIRK
jgi:hypothetical protein